MRDLLERGVFELVRVLFCIESRSLYSEPQLALSLSWARVKM
jgi:hypothetical protein